MKSICSIWLAHAQAHALCSDAQRYLVLHPGDTNRVRSSGAKRCLALHALSCELEAPTRYSSNRKRCIG